MTIWRKRREKYHFPLLHRDRFIFQICCPRKTSLSPISSGTSDDQTPNKGFANSDGIVFSSLHLHHTNNYPPNLLNQNPNLEPIQSPNPIDANLHSIQAILAEQPIALNPSITLDQKLMEQHQSHTINTSIAQDPSNDNLQVPASSNSVLNFVGGSPFNVQTPSTTFLEPSTQQQPRPQETPQSPLSLLTSSLTFAPLLAFPAHASMPQSDSNQLDNQVSIVAAPKPSFPTTLKPNKNKDKTQSRCGISNVRYATRVVGGQETGIGKI